MNILILAEKIGNELHPSVQSALTAAKKIASSTASSDITVVTASLVTNELIELAEKSTFIIGCQRNKPQTVLATLSAKLDRIMVSGVKKVVAPFVYERSTYAGRIIETVDVSSSSVVISIDANAFPLTELKDEQITHLNSELPFKKTKETLTDLSKPNLSNAKTIVSVGGGIGEPKNIAIIEPLLEKLNAVIGAGRGAVDSGAVKIDTLIGQSGKTVSPDLYIAIGISGASQHIAGIKDSKKIIAINKDPQALIFQYADVGIAGDFKEIVPKLVQALS